MDEVRKSDLRVGTMIRIGGIEIEVVDEVPDGAVETRWPRPAPVVTIRARAGGEFLWQHMYPVGSNDGANCLKASPQPARALLVAGGVPHYIDVHCGRVAADLPIQDVSIVTDCSTDQWLMVASNVHLAVIGIGGPLWLLDRLSWDGLQHLCVREGTLVGQRWDVETDTWSGFQFNLINGELAGGILTPKTVTRILRLSH